MENIEDPKKVEDAKPELAGMTANTYDENFAPNDLVWIVKHNKTGTPLYMEIAGVRSVALYMSEADGHRLIQIYCHDSPHYTESSFTVEQMTKEQLDALAAAEGFDLVVMRPNDLHEEFANRGIVYN